VVRIERSLAKRTDRLIAVGDQVRDDLLAAGVGKPEQFRTVPPGVDLGPIPERNEARESLGLDQDVPVVCFIGRLAQIKRIDRLAKVIRATSEDLPDVNFVVAGHGSEFALLERMQAEEKLNLHLLGWYQDVARVLAASDALVLTSDNEGTPVSIIQAMHVGVPTVATRVGSVHTLIQDGETGILTDLSSEAIAESLVQLLSDRILRDRLAERGKQVAAEEFGARSLESAHRAIYEELLSG